MKWQNWMQYAAMVLMAAAVPISMNIGLWTAALFGLTTLVKMVADRRMGNRSLSRPVRIALYMPIAYWLIHVASLALGGSMDEGLRVVWHKAVLLIFAIGILIADTDYLSPKLMRGLFYALWASCLGVFIYFCAVGVGRLADGETLRAITNESFDTRHHAYVSLYVVSTLAFLYVELSRHWRELACWLRWVLIASVPLLVMYVVLVNSRAGLIVMWGVLILCAVHLMRRSWWRGALLAVVVGGYIVGIGALLPGHQDRLVSTAQNLINERTDARITINQNALQLASEQSLVGHGAGSYREELVDQYAEAGYSAGVSAGYNAHNQYVETLLSTGVIGLVLLLAYLTSPLWLSLWSKRRQLFPAALATAIVMVNLVVESMLERQMGLLFVGWFYALMVLSISAKEK